MSLNAAIFFAMVLLSAKCWGEVEILAPGLIYADDLKKVNRKANWYQVIKEESVYRIKKSEIKVIAQDTSGEEINEYEIVTKEDTLFYFSGVDPKQNVVPIIPETAGHRHLGIGTIFELDKSGSQIFVTGSVKMQDGKYLYPREKSIYVRIKGKNYLIITDKYGLGFSLIWSGDLNNDGYPDILLEHMAEKGSGTQLYMSEKTKEGYRFKSIASFQHQGC